MTATEAYLKEMVKILKTINDNICALGTILKTTNENACTHESDDISEGE